MLDRLTLCFAHIVLCCCGCLSGRRQRLRVAPASATLTLSIVLLSARYGACCSVAGHRFALVHDVLHRCVDVVCFAANDGF